MAGGQGEPLVSVTEAVDGLDPVVVIETEYDGADDVVQPRTEAPAGDYAAGQLSGVEKYRTPRARELEGGGSEAL